MVANKSTEPVSIRAPLGSETQWRKPCFTKVFKGFPGNRQILHATLRSPLASPWPDTHGPQEMQGFPTFSKGCSMESKGCALDALRGLCSSATDRLPETLVLPRFLKVSWKPSDLVGFGHVSYFLATAETIGFISFCAVSQWRK